MDTYFNELSIKNAPDKVTARHWMNNLLTVYRKAAVYGFKELKTTQSFMEITLAPGYPLRQWLNDNAVDLETRRLLWTIASKSPYIENILDLKELSGQGLFECKYNNNYAAGLGAARLFDSLALSFDNSDEWDTHLLQVEITEYSEEDEIHQTREEVKHGSKPGHLGLLAQWIKEKKKSFVPNGTILWLSRKVIFPHLSFCKSTESQLTSLRPGQPEFHAIVKRLFELETYCENWNTGAFNADNRASKITEESPSRRKKYVSELTFTCPDEQSRFFSWHARYTPGAGRIHFYPDNSKRVIYIGYIGPKIQ
jgi:hypothetical protein